MNFHERWTHGTFSFSLTFRFCFVTSSHSSFAFSFSYALDDDGAAERRTIEFVARGRRKPFEHLIRPRSLQWLFDAHSCAGTPTNALAQTKNAQRDERTTWCHLYCCEEHHLNKTESWSERHLCPLWGDLPHTCTYSTTHSQSSHAHFPSLYFYGRC